MNRFPLLACLLACGLMLGCAAKAPPTGTVKGRVTIGGATPPEPIRVHFINSIIGQGSSATTRDDGSYELAEPIRVAEYTVYFEKYVDYTRGAVSTAQETLTIIPREYRTEATSPLTYEVNAGANTIDIELPGAAAGAAAPTAADANSLVDATPAAAAPAN